MNREIKKFDLNQLQGKKVARPGLKLILGGFDEEEIVCDRYEKGYGQCFEELDSNTCEWTGMQNDYCYLN